MRVEQIDEQMRLAVAHYSRCSMLHYFAKSFYRSAMLANLQTEGTVLERETKQKAASRREERLRGILEGMCKGLYLYVELGRTLQSDDRAQARSTGAG